MFLYLLCGRTVPPPQLLFTSLQLKLAARQALFSGEEENVRPLLWGCCIRKSPLSSAVPHCALEPDTNAADRCFSPQIYSGFIFLPSSLPAPARARCQFKARRRRSDMRAPDQS
uniref:Uncharacterized protein n=1 Tax=Knipowitschia caucasica TaxID=637954 RepID=A0AAV2M5R0_KNICA